MRFNRDKFFAGMRAWGKLTQPQVDGLTSLLDGFEDDEEMRDVRWIAYALATVKHETANTYQPIAEYGKGRGKPYGRKDTTTGQTYYGRGFVQLTHRDNYERLGDEVGVDLVNHPDLAMDPDIAYQVLSAGMREGLFTGKKLSTYINDKKCDYLNARRIINLMDKAQLIAGYATRFEKILKESTEDEPIQNGEVAEVASTAVSTEIVKTTTVEETAAGTETKETTLVEKITGNETVKEIAKTGMSKVGERVSTGAFSGGSGTTIWGVITGNWRAILVGLVFVLIGAAVWALIYTQRKKLQAIIANILSDKDKTDVRFVNMK